MQTKKKSVKSGLKAKSASRVDGSWASTIKQALKRKPSNQGPTEATAKSHASQSFAHSKRGRSNPPR